MSVGELWISLIGYIVIYGLLIVADLYLLLKFAKAGPGSKNAAQPEKAPAGTPAGVIAK